MRASGVAIPSAQGYPRTRTASAANAPRWTFGPPPQARGPDQPNGKRKRGDSQHARNEVLEHAVGELDDAGFHGPSLLDLAGNLIQERILTGCGHLDEQRPGFVDATADHLVAALALLDGDGLAGGNRLVDR